MPLFVFPLLLFLLRLAFLHFKQGKAWKECWPQMALLFVPVGAYVAIILLVSSFNYAKWGIFATNEQQAPGFSGLLDTLYEIETPDPSIWAPVTSRTLEMAMDLENHTHLFYKKAAEEMKDEKVKTLYRLLAEEEKAHYDLLRKSLDYLADPSLYFG